MTLTIKHAKTLDTVAHPDQAADIAAGKLLGSDWNSNHSLIGTADISQGGTGASDAVTAINALLPLQTGNNGKFLATDGSAASWSSPSGSGTVTDVSVVTANGVSGSVATSTSTPAITLLLGAITPSSVAATGTVGGSNLSGNNTGDQTIALTGDVTGSGIGSFAATLATVNANTGSFGSSSSIPNFTVNGKGLITAAGGNAVVAPAGTLTGATLAAGVTSSSLTSFGLNPVVGTQSASDNSTRAASTGYVTTAVANALNGLDWKPAVGYATTANVVGTNVAGIFTYTATGVDTIDGHTLALNDVVLFKNQTTQADNGVWVVTTAGAIGVAGVLTRRSDYNVAAEVHDGDTFFVQNGTTNGATSWVQTRVVNTIDSDSLAFSQVSGPGTYAAGTGLTLTGNSFSVNASQIQVTAVGTLTGGATGAGFTIGLGTSTITGILGSANGGTGNGFTKFSGPATAEKTFTLPNASAAILTDNAAVTVAQGGTGLQTLTAHGVMLGEGTGAVAFATIGTSGRLLIDQGAAADPSFNAMSGDATISNAGAVTLAASTYNAVPSAQVVTVNNAASPYTVGANDYVILVDTSGGAVTLNLPSPSTKKRIKIKDSTGNFGTNNCTVARNGTEKIEGIAASLILYADWGNYELQSNGTDWFKVGGGTNLAHITYGTSGGTFTCPAGITQVIITGRGGSGGGGGGGAGGGGSTGAGAAGGGGGGSGGSVYTVSKTVTVVPNTAYTVTVGSGGSVGTAGTVTTANAAGSTGGNGGVGGNGGNTSFGSLFSAPGGFGGGPANGGQLAAVGTGGYAGEGVYYGVAGANGGLANASGSNTTQQFIFSPWAADASTANGTGGSAGGASGGGGGGAGGIPAPGDGAQPNGVTAGNGGASGANGATGTAINAASNGVGGQGGTGGGGGGLKASTGSQGGAGKAGGIGVAGFLTVSWQE